MPPPPASAPDAGRARLLRLVVAGVGRGAAGEPAEVSALWLRPADARACCVLGHGAGAGMRHAFLEGMAGKLAARHVASFRYQFPYMEAGTRRPDPRPRLLATVRAAVAAAADAAPDLPLFAGGKSMGGRMTSLAAAESGGGGLAGVRGLVFLGFPLHPAGRPSSERGQHLRDVGLPMLFLQGTRDRLAEIARVEALVRELAPDARLHVVEGADHSFHVPKRSGRRDDEVQDELAAAIARWTAATGPVA